MKNNQRNYIEYVMKFAEKTKSHIWLGGSFLHGNATTFSDVDMSVYCNTENISKLIYGYGKPVYISYTSNPSGILIVIYEDGVAVDLEIIEKIDVVHKGFFHAEDIKQYNYTRNETMCKELSLRNDIPYQISRLFHRSLIKFFSGKREVGVSVANEIVTYMDSDRFVDEENYENGFTDILKSFEKQFPLPKEYYALLCELIEEFAEVRICEN